MFGGAVHGASIGLAAVAVLVGFVAGLMYFGKAWRLKHKRLPIGGLSLPSLEWLQSTNGLAIVVAVVMLGVGVVSGLILNRINIDDPIARLGWTDPFVLCTWLMFVWLLAAGDGGRRPASGASWAPSGLPYAGGVRVSGDCVVGRPAGRDQTLERKGKGRRVGKTKRRILLALFSRFRRPSAPGLYCAQRS